MAGPIQIGDALRLAELAWRVWEYGFASEHNAGEHYRAFGVDVHTLHQSLGQLEDAIRRAQTSLLASGAHRQSILVDDQRSFSDIVGDYKDTLRACYQLIDDNRRYAQTTGPFLNIDWNFNVMPQVEHLRARIQMHNLRIQHLLRPFEIDLANTFQGILTRRLTALHTDIHRMASDIRVLIAENFPDAARAIEEREQQSLCSINVPDYLFFKFDSDFSNHGFNRPPNLQDITDCFLVHLGRSTALLLPMHGVTQAYPPITQYLELLKCQFLMIKIKSWDEIRQPQRGSYWSGYVRSLEEDLSQQCFRFRNELRPPDASNVGDGALSIWSTVEPRETVLSLPIGPPHDLVLELPLVPASTWMTWRTMQLYRQIGSDYRYRIVEETGNPQQPVTEGPRIVDFDTRTTVLIPIYADPLVQGNRPPPLEIILEHSHQEYHYLFPDMKSLLQFQRALTGYQVADSYTYPHATAMFVRPGKEETFKELATLQLWIPTPSTERHQADRAADYRSLSSGSAQSASLNFSHTRRALSVSSSRSGATASSASHSSSGFEDSIAVRLGGSVTASDHGTIRSIPRKPLLVLFTRKPNTEARSTVAERSIVVISIDAETEPNPERCRCQNDPNCYFTAIEQSRGSTLQAQRLDPKSRWNLLSIPSRAPNWKSLSRISILFSTIDARKRFGGSYCICRVVTEADVDECLQKKHLGLLGLVRTLYRRQVLMSRGESDSSPIITNRS